MCASLFSPDDLDTKSLEFAKSFMQRASRICFAADIGASPYAPQAIRFAEAGLMADAFDIEEPHPELCAISKELGEWLSYIKINLSSVTQLPTSHNYDVVYANRLFAHLRYNETNDLLALFLRKCTSDVGLFLSFSALESSLGEGYPDRNCPVQQRFACPVKERSSTNELGSPLCLYTPADVTEVLLPEVGLTAKEVFVSKSGSIKVIAGRKG